MNEETLEISFDQIEKERGKYLLIDTRDKVTVEYGMIPGAISVPEQELEERHLDQQAGAGQRHHGSGVLEPDAQNDRVQRCQYAQGQAARTEDCREIPAQQKQRCAENSLPHEPDALPDGLPQAAALQNKQGQHQRCFYRHTSPDAGPLEHGQ